MLTRNAYAAHVSVIFITDRMRCSTMYAMQLDHAYNDHAYNLGYVREIQLLLEHLQITQIPFDPVLICQLVMRFKWASATLIYDLGGVHGHITN